MAMAKTETVCFGSDKGGAGKSLAASLWIARYQMANGGKLPTIVEVEARPRLAKIYGADRVKHFAANRHTPEEIEADPSLTYETWDGVAGMARASKAPVVIDMGANLTRAFAAYLAEQGDYGAWGMGASFTFYAVTTGEPNAVEAARDGLHFMGQALPESRRFLVVNGRDERVLPLDVNGPGVRSIVEETKAHGALRVPACTSQAFSAVVDRHMPLVEAVKVEPSQWQQDCGLTFDAAARAARRLAVFLRDGVQAFDPTTPHAAPA
jgi:hypothetical protein